MNNLTIAGRLVSDAVTNQRNIAGNIVSVTEIRVAVPDGRWIKDENGGHYEHTEFFRVPLWRDYGTKLAPYLKQGREVVVTGAVYAKAWIGTKGEAVGKAMADLYIRNARVTLQGKNPTATTAEDEAPFDPDFME